MPTSSKHERQARRKERQRNRKRTGGRAKEKDKQQPGKMIDIAGEMEKMWHLENRHAVVIRRDAEGATGSTGTESRTRAPSPGMRKVR